MSFSHVSLIVSLLRLKRCKCRSHYTVGELGRSEIDLPSLGRQKRSECKPARMRSI